MLSSRAAMVLVRAAENEMLQPHTGLQVQPHKDHKYRDLFPSSQPSSFVDSTHPGFVCRLNKSLYGLKSWLEIARYSFAIAR